MPPLPTRQLLGLNSAPPKRAAINPSTAPAHTDTGPKNPHCTHCLCPSPPICLTRRALLICSPARRVVSPIMMGFFIRMCLNWRGPLLLALNPTASLVVLFLFFLAQNLLPLPPFNSHLFQELLIFISLALLLKIPRIALLKFKKSPRQRHVRTLDKRSFQFL